MKRLTSRRSTRPWAGAAVALATAGLAACQSLVTTVPLSDQLAPLDLALLEAPEAIEARANSGDGQAQLAMAIITFYGLAGRRRDAAAADRWRGQARSNRRFMPITQYTAAFNGSPSRVNIINVPVQAISPAQWQAVERCIALIAGGDTSDQNACGDANEFQHRRAAWRRSIEDSPIQGR